MNKKELEEWIIEVERLKRGGDDDGVSAREVSDILGLSMETTRKRLRDALMEGRIEHAGYREERRIDGLRCRIPVYKFINGQKNRKRKS